MSDKIKSDLLELLIEQERQLLEPSVRQSNDMLEQLLSNDFYEISANGLIFNKQYVLSRLPDEKVPQFYNQAFQGRMLTAQLAQLSYHAAYRRNVKYQLNYSIRMSLWRLEYGKWRLVFHQGTPCAEFKLHLDE
ncbi:hypothetical protein PSECIP111951_00225 [Pseudoalteromonas holothuriae]|uniref:DUF4440 domain-containing protein n=1 Tax=Pseudoalteromonas holothuriae TaxID=2963714 RepID=A0A9W4VSL1_9GAMM|nr:MULTISPECIES: DUF4440 domain-containing protein [unclassified Pseudoalteromonas]CAH9050603.1 hypothetical protein PSECIP111951_00225 [Pseudoalteromonas sp. CIP111951]CAH9061266.1 hypothetical protein PSECIP111854_02772 [Pseudoalteromonas sp. CIP111854]